MILIILPGLLSLLHLTLAASTTPLWWIWDRNAEASNHKRTTLLCNALSPFNSKQRVLCAKYPDLMAHILHGARSAVKECARQMSSNRWNCSSVPAHGTLFGPVLPVGCRESAFLYAITSAGVAHALTSACSAGTYRSCGCDRTRQAMPDGEWEWRGCHSNVKFGGSLTKQFANARDPKNGSPQRKKMNRHNIRAGVKALSSLTFKKCKCHGVCGSCELKTCWMQHMKDFDIVAKHLKEKYHDPVEMIRSKKGARTLRVKHKKSRKPDSGDLIYYEHSPNFCDRNRKYGIPGTSGRPCNMTSHGMDSCSLLCCGRGYNVQVVTERVKCNCQFIWCCHVKCETCIGKRDFHTCK